MILRPLFAEQPDQAAEGELVDALIDVIDPGFLHGCFLLFRDRGVRVYPEHEGEKGIDEILDIGHAHVRAELFEQHAHPVHGATVRQLEAV